MKKLLGQLTWFVMVGCAAAATHWLVAVTCISQWHAPAALANFAGWLVALWVSFSGHYFLTFQHHTKTWWPALQRFVGVSLAGFVLNELAFLSLLRWTSVPYTLALALVLVGVAALTFVLSRYWAFRHNPSVV